MVDDREGVAKEVRERGINIEMKPGVYMPVRQSERYWPVPADLGHSNRSRSIVEFRRQQAALASVDRDQSLSDIRSMGEVVDLELSDQKQQNVTPLCLCRSRAHAPAVAGIYGVISYLVSQREREIRSSHGLRCDSRSNTAHGVSAGRRAILIAGVLAGVVLALTASPADRLHAIRCTARGMP